MRFRSATVLGTFALAALVVLGVPGAAGAVNSATGSATPTTDLLDGETIAVSGVGFDANAQVGVAECLTEATVPGQCDLTGVMFTTTNQSGSFSIEFNVMRFINVGGEITDCAAPDSCVLGMEETANTSLSVTVGISFENVPVVPPIVQVDPSTNLIDRQSVQVEGTGFTPRASIALVECENGSVAIGDCDLSTILIVRADSNGNVESTYQVTRVITVDGSNLDCAAPNGCALGAGNVDDYAQRSVVPVSFANAPVPKPAVTVVPSPGPNPTTPAGTLAMTGYSPWLFVRIGSGLAIAGFAMLAASRLRRSRV
jgi:hypothetical protein